MCDEKHDMRLEATNSAMLNCSPERIRLCHLQKFINFLKLRNIYGIDGFPNECLRHLHSALTFSHVLEGNKNDSPVLRPRKGPRFHSNL
jgi:hypothetical protein